MSNQKLSINKPIVSISDLCQMLNLSRSRYYQLVESGFFPPPVYDLKSKRPFYNADLQQQCLESRQSGVGADGSLMLFYSPRKTEIRAKMRKPKVNKQVQEYVDTLQAMGLEVTGKDVKIAIAEYFPDGTQGQDEGIVIRELYRFIKQKS